MKKTSLVDIKEMVRSFQFGQEKGFNYFFGELYPKLLYFAWRLLNDKEAAEDVVAESFVKVWARHTTFSHEKVIQSWMYTTVKNGCLNVLQRQQRTDERNRLLAKMTEGNYENYILQEMIRAEVIKELYQCIETLPDACKQIFKMLYIQGMTVRKIAEQLNLSISTIKNQKARGINLIRLRFPEFKTFKTFEINYN